MLKISAKKLLEKNSSAFGGLKQLFSLTLFLEIFLTQVFNGRFYNFYQHYENLNSVPNEDPASSTGQAVWNEGFGALEVNSLRLRSLKQTSRLRLFS